MRFIAEFTPQVWFNDHAIAVDPRGDTVWDVTRHLSMLAPNLRLRACESGTFESDGLREALTAPEWIRDWDNPFEIEIHVEAESPEEQAALLAEFGSDYCDEAVRLIDRLPYVDPEAEAASDETVQGDGAENDPRAEFVVIHEGGSSEELYIHSSDNHDDAQAFRLSCLDEGGYRTSEVIEVPAALAAQGEALYELLEQVARAQLAFPEGDAPAAEEADQAMPA